MASFLDELFDQTPDDPESLQWGITGASIFSPNGAKKRAALGKQDYLQTIIERDADTVTARISGSMIDYVDTATTGSDSPGERLPIEDALVDPKIKIVSLTVTEGGYFLSSSKGQFDPENPDMVEDARLLKAGERPRTPFGFIVKAIKERRETGVKPFSVVTCDNIPHNGNVVRGVVAGLAGLYDKELAAWIEENVAFPNSMVDRITPATSDREREFVREKLGYEDCTPIFCEPFTQWVLEDTFPENGRPALEKVAGIKFVDDVEPYELMKIRILNGGHASLCYPAALLEVQFVHEAMEHPVIGPFIDTVERNEIIPTVPPVPDTDLTEYWELIEKRFLNPTLDDTIARNCYDGASRQPKFIIPPVTDALKLGTGLDGLAIVSALWCRYCQGKTEFGNTIEPNDPIWDRLHATALKAKDDPAVWLAMEDIYGAAGSNSRFIESFTAALKSIQEKGVETTLKAYVEKYAKTS